PRSRIDALPLGADQLSLSLEDHAAALLDARGRDEGNQAAQYPNYRIHRRHAPRTKATRGPMTRRNDYPGLVNRPERNGGGAENEKGRPKAASAGNSMSEPFIGASAKNASMRAPVAASIVNEAIWPLNDPVRTTPRSAPTTTKSTTPSPLLSMRM